MPVTTVTIADTGQVLTVNTSPTVSVVAVGQAGPQGPPGGAVIVQDEGTTVTPSRTVLNFIGAGVSVADDSGNTRTNVTVNGPPGDSSTTVKGVTKVSVAPVSSTNPISVGDNDSRVTADQVAGTASIRTLGTGATQAAAGNHVHAQSAITNLVSDLALKAPLASPALTGTPSAPTAATGTDTTQVASTAFVQQELRVVVVNTQTTSYTLVITDAGKVVEMNSGSANTLTVPPNSSVAFPIGTVLEVYQKGAGTTSVAPGAGVTIRSRGSVTSVAGQYGVAGLRKAGTDEWVLAGDLA